MTADHSRTLVTVVGIDAVRPKNLYQTRWLQEHGFAVHVMTLHRDAGSIQADPSATIEPIIGGPVRRVRQFVSHLRQHRRSLHHVELYPGGRFAFVYALLCRLLRIPLLVVERGDLLQCQQRVYPLSARLSIYACYRLANRVWLREPYMLRAFARWRVSGSFFLPNGVPVPADAPPASERDLDVIWVNRLIRERHPDWFARAIARLSVERPLTCEVLGLRASDSGPATRRGEQELEQLLADLPGCVLRPYVNPVPGFRRARWFVLPSDIVFGNFALLEAMSHGAVPIVSDVEGTDQIVRDGVEGFVAEHSPEGLHRTLERALALDEPSWQTMSDAARQTIVQRFSIDAWGERLLHEYAVLRRRA